MLGFIPMRHPANVESFYVTMANFLQIELVQLSEEFIDKELPTNPEYIEERGAFVKF